MPVMPMFPLGAPLLPSMPVVLRVFEERYLVMLAEILQDEHSEFGIVLIERGTEAGGGEARFDIGTVARITELLQGDGFVGVVGTGRRRFTVSRWLEDDPYPRADVAFLPELEWDESARPALEETERAVRRALAQASEFGDGQRWSATVELTEDPVESAWQLAGVAPIGDLDRLELLRATSVDELLASTARLSAAAVELMTMEADDGDLPGLDELRP
jgi:uncharacterized protein